MYHRFFPGPQGTGANVVVPMTDWSIPEVDGDRMTTEALKRIMENTEIARQRLRSSGLAQGNKIASDMRILLDLVTEKEIVVELFGGPTLRDDITYKLRLPQTPATLRAAPQTMEQLLEIYADKMMGGNISNVLRNQMQIAQADLGPSINHVFCPADKYLDEWLEDKLQNAIDQRFVRHELTGLDQRIGLATPYIDDSGKIQQFSFNKPQGSTIGPMGPWMEKLDGLDYVVVSEGLSDMLAANKIAIAQIFNPTSALHMESALEMHRRKEQKGHWQDVPIVNDDEMEQWIRIMENRQFGTPMKDIPDAKFPMPFLKSDRRKLDAAAIKILSSSHRRFLTLGNTRETEHADLVAGVGCGPKGGQNLFQCKGRHFVTAASALTDKGAEHLLSLCGSSSDCGVRIDIRDVVGAGDAAFTASLMHRLYAPLEEIVDSRHPNLSQERRRIVTMAFTTILQRVFGELVYHSKGRDLSAVPPPAFPIIFDKTLDKSIDAALQLTTIDKVPSSVYHDNEWDMSFMVMEVEARHSNDSSGVLPSGANAAGRLRAAFLAMLCRPYEFLKSLVVSNERGTSK